MTEIGKSNIDNGSNSFAMGQSSHGLQCADSVVEWFWEHGVKRVAQFAVSSAWLDSLYQRRDLLRSIDESDTHSRASVGLWGPSQSGKSTLISQFVDHGADDNGRGGALHWHVPAVFSSRLDLPPDVVVFNPHNLGSDASGCVSRFVLRESMAIPFDDCPVEIQLLNRGQLLHAIAAGYSSECKSADDRPWTPESLYELLESYSGAATSSALDRGAFEHLHDVLEVLDLLIGAGHPRFTQLDAAGRWASSLRARVLQTSQLSVDVRKAREFATKILWDNKPSLTRLYDRLTEFRDRLPHRALSILCGMDVAATLVNIDAYRIFKSDNQHDSLTGVRRIKDTIRRLSWEERQNRILVGTNFANRLLERDDDFGLLQGLVRELVIPLRHAQKPETIGRGASFARFMEAAELVDFPGVPLRDSAVQEMRLDLDELTDPDDTRLLTDVLKRGKVASLVNAYSRSLGLDAFVLLVRAGHFAAKPQLLHRGIIAWWRFFDPSYDVYRRPFRKPPLPLFFNLTFFGAILDKVAQGAAATGLRPLLDMVQQLDPLVDPRICTLLATTYPQFEEGKIHVPANAAEAAVLSITTDASFGPRWAAATSKQSLHDMAKEPDGGVGHLFSVLADSVSAAARTRLLEERRVEAFHDLRSLLIQQAPQGEGDRRRQDAESVQQAIQNALDDKQATRSARDPAAMTSFHLRKLFDVDPETLDPLPTAASATQKYESYIETQVRKWIDSKASIPELHEIGLGDPALRGRLLGYFAERVRAKDLAKWMKDEIPSPLSREDARELRRTLAILLGNKLTGRNGHEHPQLDGSNGVIATIRRWAESEEQSDATSWKDSPHYAAVIQPALRLLDDVASGHSGDRPPQPGDNQAQQLLAGLADQSAAES